MEEEKEEQERQRKERRDKEEKLFSEVINRRKHGSLPGLQILVAADVHIYCH